MIKIRKERCYYFGHYLNSRRMLMFRTTEMIHTLLIIPEESGPHINRCFLEGQIITVCILLANSEKQENDMI